MYTKIYTEAIVRQNTNLVRGCALTSPWAARQPAKVETSDLGHKCGMCGTRVLFANTKKLLCMNKLLGHVISAEDFPSDFTHVLGFTTAE